MEFIKFVEDQSQAYATPNVIITMGGDFNYQSASAWFLNLDSLIKYTNEIAEQKGLKINVFYSTPACYMKAVEDANIKLTTKTDDFFPYASDPTAYWTGYFTSRPTTKYYERQSNAALQMFKQLIVLMGAEDTSLPVLEEFKSAMGMMQHHDAITGTEKQHVANDYMKILYKANHNADGLISHFFSTILNDNTHMYNDRCQLNISSCFTTMSRQFSMAVYNPLAWTVTEIINIPVTSKDSYDIYGPNGEKMAYQVLPVTDDIKKIPRRLNQNFYLILPAVLPPMSVTTYYIKKNHSKSRRTVNFDEHKLNYAQNMNSYAQNFNNYAQNTNNYAQNKHNIYERKPDRLAKNDETIFNAIQMFPLNGDEMRMLGDDPLVINMPRKPEELVQVLFDHDTSAITYSYKDLDFGIKMGRYNSCSGDNVHERASGAYIFRPNGTLKGLRGDIMNYNLQLNEYFVDYEENVFLKFRYYDLPGINYTDVFWTVGPIDIKDRIGKEYVVKYKTNLMNNGIFYTDSNGRQMIERKRNYQPEFNITLEEPVPGNYYPITNRISIKSNDGNNTKMFSVLTDRSEGASSLNDGEIEIMLHRRMLNDDGFGVGEPLNETEYNKGLIVTGRHRIYFSDKQNDVYVKKLTIQNDLEPKVYFSKGEGLNKWLGTIKQYSFINEFPFGLHLLTLEPWRKNELLLRLENYFEKTDQSNTDIHINLNSIFKTLNVDWYRETYLAANIWKGDVVHNNFDVKVKAKEIKTFIVGYNH